VGELAHAAPERPGLREEVAGEVEGLHAAVVVVGDVDRARADGDAARAREAAGSRAGPAPHRRVRAVEAEALDAVVARVGHIDVGTVDRDPAPRRPALADPPAEREAP